MNSCVAPSVTAAASAGKFCRLLAPVSASPASLAVTPSHTRSMPSPPLLRILLPSTALPVLAPVTDTPLLLLLAIRLPAPAAVPPTRLLLAPSLITTPEPLPKLPAPLESVPMKLPDAALLFVPLPLNSMPA